MSYRKPVGEKFLRSLLTAVVDEWGFEVVRKRLDDLRFADSKLSAAGEGGDSLAKSDGVRTRSNEKPTAVAMAAKISLPPKQKELIQTLAVRFDDKQFLPSSGDIRYFFDVHGEVAPLSKQRTELFRRVLKLLSTLPESALLKIVNSEAHSGPSRVGPLSEALRGAGEARAVERSVAPTLPLAVEEDVEGLNRNATKPPPNA